MAVHITVSNGQQLSQCGVNIEHDVPVQCLRKHQRQLFSIRTSSKGSPNLDCYLPALIPMFAVSGIVDFCTAVSVLPRTR
jgi:hypothetical protein